MIAFKMVVDPFTQLNAGAFRPIDLLFPAGSMVNCLPPTSHAASNVVSSERAASVVYGALAQAAPEKAFAENLSSTGIICWGGEDDRTGEPQPFVNMQLSFGSWGGTANADGLPYCLSVVGNCSEIPVEILEVEYPFVCLDKEFMIDTAGPGRRPRRPGYHVHQPIARAGGDLALMRPHAVRARGASSAAATRCRRRCTR